MAENQIVQLFSRHIGSNTEKIIIMHKKYQEAEFHSHITLKRLLETIVVLKYDNKFNDDNGDLNFVYSGKTRLINNIEKSFIAVICTRDVVITILS